MSAIGKIPDRLTQIKQNAQQVKLASSQEARSVWAAIHDAISDLGQEIQFVKKHKQVEMPKSTEEESYQHLKQEYTPDSVIDSIDQQIDTSHKNKESDSLTVQEKDASLKKINDQALALLEETKLKGKTRKAKLSIEEKMAKIAALKTMLEEVEFDDAEDKEQISKFFHNVDNLKAKQNRNKELGRRLTELEERQERQQQQQERQKKKSEEQNEEQEKKI
jgi:hypothetical protein